MALGSLTGAVDVFFGGVSGYSVFAIYDETLWFLISWFKKKKEKEKTKKKEKEKKKADVFRF